MRNESLYQTIITAIIVITTAVLAYHGTVDDTTFTSLTILILGYVFGRNVSRATNGG